MDVKQRAYLAELVGTFAVVFVGAGSVCASHVLTTDSGEPRLSVTGLALAEGCTLAVVLTMAQRLPGGYFNPALTLMLWVFKRFDWGRAAILIGLQLLGAVLAGLALRFCFTEEILTLAHFGAPHLKAFLAEGGVLTTGSLVSGVGVELVLTFLVTVAVFATLLDRRGPRLGGVLVGMAQVAAVVLGFHLTGGAANPARWFGPAVWELTVPTLKAGHPFADHAVYWVGPVLGALLGAFFYTAVLQPPEDWVEPDKR
jgi:glycerol uptake facilitator-like aquaporin